MLEVNRMGRRVAVYWDEDQARMLTPDEAVTLAADILLVAIAINASDEEA